MELKVNNKDNSVELDASRNVLNRLYMCFKVMRMGFMTRSKPIIGLDRCFLKSPLQDQIFSAIGRDTNNQMYPIAYVVFKRENIEN